MSLFKEKLNIALENVIIDEKKREKALHIGCYGLFSFLSLIFALVDLLNNNYSVSIAIFIFSILCDLNILFVLFRKEKLYLISKTLFGLEIIGLQTFFIINGSVDGMLIMWSLLLPSLGLFLFNERIGSILSFVVLLLYLFFFWIPFGTSLLNYDYSFDFRIRFPIIYVTFYLFSIMFYIVLQKTYIKYRHLYTHDDLTNLLNRRGFEEEIKVAIDKTSDDDFFGFIIFDLDNFKLVNDMYGHYAGDDILKESTKVLKEICNLPICRWGGEEFAAFDNQGIISEEYVYNLCHKFEEYMKIHRDIDIKLTVSIGAILIKKDSTLSYFKMLKLADNCLYKAKNGGKNQAVFEMIN